MKEMGVVIMKNTVYALVVLVCSVLLVGCAHSVQVPAVPVVTQMSQPVALDGVPDSAKTVYFKLQNETELSTAYMTTQIRQRLHEQGFRFETNPQYAHYLLHVDVKRIVRVTQNIALAIGASPYNVSLATVPLDPKGKDGFYTGVADIKLVEKTAYTRGGRSLHLSRLVAYPQQQNLKRKIAEPVIEHALVKRIAGIFDLQG